jgi:hypothetical protein
VHTGLNWTFGPFRYLIASPVFHRWHHTGHGTRRDQKFHRHLSAHRSDLRHLLQAEGALGDAYGTDEPEFPRSFGRQLLYPFVAPNGAESAENDGGGGLSEMPPVGGSGGR